MEYKCAELGHELRQLAVLFPSCDLWQEITSANMNLLLNLLVLAVPKSSPHAKPTSVCVYMYIYIYFRLHMNFICT